MCVELTRDIMEFLHMLDIHVYISYFCRLRFPHTTECVLSNPQLGASQPVPIGTGWWASCSPLTLTKTFLRWNDVAIWLTQMHLFSLVPRINCSSFLLCLSYRASSVIMIYIIAVHGGDVWCRHSCNLKRFSHQSVFFVAWVACGDIMQHIWLNSISVEIV